jgi:UrcA family protein
MHRPLMLALASAIAFGFAAAAPASAAERAAVRVSYADLNLDNRAGAEVMLRRLERAAEFVCGDRRGTIPLAVRIRVERCVNEEMADEVAELGHANVTALYYRRNPEVIIAAR